MGDPAVPASLLPRCPAGRSWEPAREGESGAKVFRRSDGWLFAKCATRRGVRELRDERDRIRWLATTDVPCPTVADWSERDEGACLVTTGTHGILACDVARADVPRALVSLASVLSRLHRIPVETCPFDRRLSVTVPVAEDVVRRGAVHPVYLEPGDRETPPTELLALVQGQLDRLVRLESGDLVVCHGDACLPNVILDPETLDCVGVVDLGRLGVADRYLDLSLLSVGIRSEEMNPQYTADDADTLLRAYGLDSPDQERVRLYQLLDALSWG